MNLCANLLYDGEMRSASMVSLKSMLVFAAFLIPVLVLIMILHAHIKLQESLSTLAVEEARWAVVEKQQERADKLRLELRAVNSAAAEIVGWQRSRPEWHLLLDGLRGHVPPDIQLKVMNVRHTLELNEKDNLQRLIIMTLNGRCIGPDADANVQGFRQHLLDEPPFDTAASNIVVSGLVEDLEPGAREGDRSFSIDMDLKPRVFVEASGR